jgi:aminotransferase
MSVLSTRLVERARFPVGVREAQSRLAASLEDVINLSRGDPDLPTPAHILTAAQHALAERQTKYTHWQGIRELRGAIADKLRTDNGLAYGADEIVVTGGVQEAFYVAMMALIGPGDEVVYADPFYHALPRLVQFAGGVAAPVMTRESDGFVLDPAEVERRLGLRAKMLVLVTPHNPTGVVASRDTLAALADLARRRDLVVISDEIYEKLLFDDAEHLSIASFPGMRERTIVINGFSKAYAMTGFRLGYLAAPRDLVAGLEVFKENLSICAPSVSQWAGLEALRGPQEGVARSVEVYDERRRALMQGFDDLGFTYVRPRGGVFLFANVSSTGLGDVEFSQRLLAEARVTLLAGSMASAQPGYVRASWLLPVERIREAVTRIKAFVHRLRRAGTA